MAAYKASFGVILSPRERAFFGRPTSQSPFCLDNKADHAFEGNEKDAQECLIGRHFYFNFGWLDSLKLTFHAI